jgi:hypothetical protein
MKFAQPAFGGQSSLAYTFDRAERQSWPASPAAKSTVMAGLDPAIQ